MPDVFTFSERLSTVALAISLTNAVWLFFFLVDSQENVIAINILYKSTVLPVRLRHAADHLAEHEYPVHLIFLDRVPGCIALVV
ncbi:Uncharacterised protein [Klebsiella pneumoniae]|nr:Uncharacterised protein [Klebsiella pneumoniae]VAS05084.1 Uncharacterised protein [Klebsiella pneumoniae]VAT39638.1 Uncharacterised protein [Klebsiella pneumoniae]